LKDARISLEPIDARVSVNPIQGAADACVVTRTVVARVYIPSIRVQIIIVIPMTYAEFLYAFSEQDWCYPVGNANAPPKAVA